MGEKYGRRRETTVSEDLKDITKGVGRSVGGLLGDSASKLRDRGMQIDDAVDGSIHDRQHTDKANR